MSPKIRHMNCSHKGDIILKTSQLQIMVYIHVIQGMLNASSHSKILNSRKVTKAIACTGVIVRLDD